MAKFIACCHPSRFVDKLFEKYAYFVLNNSFWLITVPVIVALALCSGFFKPIAVGSHRIDLYNSKSSRSERDRVDLLDHFPINDSNEYFSLRRVDHDRKGFLVFTRKNGSNLKNDVDFKEIWSIWNMVLSIPIFVYNNANIYYDYHAMCVKEQQFCISNQFLDYWHYKRNAFELMSFPTFKKDPRDSADVYFIGDKFGGVVIANESSSIRSFDALLIPYQLQKDEPMSGKMALQWEQKLSDILKDVDSASIEVSWWTSLTVAAEVSDYMDRTFQMLNLSLLIIVVITAATSLVLNSVVHSKLWLSLGGVVSIVLGILTATAVLQFAKVAVPSPAYVMPFVIFNFGIYQVNFLIAAWQLTSTNSPVEDRFTITVKSTASILTINALINILSFLLVCINDIPALRIFCLYLALSSLFVYFYHITLFFGFVLLDAKREARQQSFLTCLRLNHTRIQHDSQGISIQTDIEEKVAKHFVLLFFRDKFSDFILNRISQAAILILFLAYLTAAAFGISRLKVVVSERSLLYGGSDHDNLHAQRSIDRYDRYLVQYGDSMHLWYTGLDQQFDDQLSLMAALEKDVERFAPTQYSSYVDNWMAAFRFFANATDLQPNSSALATQLRDQLFSISLFEVYRNDIVFDRSFKKIKAARMMIRLQNVGFANRTKAMKFFEKLAAESQLNAKVYHEYFLFHSQVDVVVPSLGLNLGVTFLAVLLLCLLLIPDPICIIWMCVCAVSINFGIIGFLPYLGITLDLTVVIALVASLVFWSSFLSFLSCFAKTGSISHDIHIRLMETLYAAGCPILLGGLSTILAVLLLMPIDAYVVRVFMKLVILATVFAVFHSLFLLPVLFVIFRTTGGKKSKTLFVDRSTGIELSQNGHVIRSNRIIASSDDILNVVSSPIVNGHVTIIATASTQH